MILFPLYWFITAVCRVESTGGSNLIIELNERTMGERKKETCYGYSGSCRTVALRSMAAVVVLLVSGWLKEEEEPVDDSG